MRSAASTHSPDALTPAMRQYVEQKGRVGDAVLLFRMGDFYETFYDDAVLCSRVLGIALTTRNRNDEKPIPLAGIPYHALDVYLRKLVAAGYKVAISEQLEDPKLAKTVIRRDVVRIVTAGTLTEETLLDEREESILAAVCVGGERVGLAWVELAGGRFETMEVASAALLDELVRLRPAEILVEEVAERGSGDWIRGVEETFPGALTRRPGSEFAAHSAERSLAEHFGVATLAGFGYDTAGLEVCAAGAVLHYLQETQKTSLPHVTALLRRSAEDSLRMDHATFRSLEIERSLRGHSRNGTLLEAIDRTVYAGGSRTLKRWIARPLIDAAGMIERHEAVGFFVEQDGLRSALREELRGLADMERIAARVALSRANPRDLAGLCRTLDRLPVILGRLPDVRPRFVEKVAGQLGGLEDVAGLLRGAIRPEPPMSLREGGFIADGFHAELDRLRTIAQDGAGWLAEYQRREVERTGLSSLKVGFNRVFGYYIELPHRDAGRVPPEYVRRQTVKNAERYITDELKRYETEVLTARERADELEFQLFEQVRASVAGRLPAILSAAEALGKLDCAAGLAELAVERRYVRPEITDDGRLEIVDGRHPVLEQALRDTFVPNDAHMSAGSGRMFIITGPNMAGKSTYIRQVALLVLLAQSGSFVPAKAMRFQPADRLFARVGSADEIVRGQSTFMVEMTEAANILHYATPRSLVILDELGRGTSTFDGLALAWAIGEHLAERTRCRTLIATHYHELTELASLMKGVRNFNVAVREYGPGDRPRECIVFLHRIVEGAADKSYGIHVAQLAGVPAGVTRRAKEVLAELERGFSRESKTASLARRRTRRDGQFELFRDPFEEIVEELRGLDPEGLSPADAARRLRAWRERFV